MLDLNDFLFFVHIVDRGGFTAASRALNVPKSTLSQRMMKLETDLGVRLLNRSSRHVGTTDAGQDFYKHAANVLREAQTAETIVRQRLGEPCGVVRFTAGLATMQFALSDIVSKFLLNFPRVDVVGHATDRWVDLVSENFDVAVRAHTEQLPDSNLVQRTLVTIDWHIFGGTRYLAARGEPIEPEELQEHPALLMTRTGAPSAWRLRHLRGARDEMVLPVSPRLASDDVLGLQNAAIMGLGIVALPSYLCRDAVRSGELRRILPDWAAGTGSLTALVPYRQGMLPSVRAFLDHLGEEVPKLAAY